MSVHLSHRSVSQTVCARMPSTTPMPVCALSPPLSACSTASSMTTRYVQARLMTAAAGSENGITAPWWPNGNISPIAGVCGSLQHNGGSVPAEEHRKDHRPGGPGEDEPPADDAAVLLQAVVSDARGVRPEVCSASLMLQSSVAWL